jgi:hypothetical protein
MCLDRNRWTPGPTSKSAQVLGDTAQVLGDTAPGFGVSPPLRAPWCPLNRNRGDARWRSDRLAGSNVRIVPQRLGATGAPDIPMVWRARSTGLFTPGAAG